MSSESCVSAMSATATGSSRETNRSSSIVDISSSSSSIPITDKPLPSTPASTNDSSQSLPASFSASSSSLQSSLYAIPSSASSQVPNTNSRTSTSSSTSTSAAPAKFYAHRSKDPHAKANYRPKSHPATGTKVGIHRFSDSESVDPSESKSTPSSSGSKARSSLQDVATSPCMVCGNELDEIIITCCQCGIQCHPSCYGVDVDQLPGGGYPGSPIPKFTCKACALQVKPHCIICGKSGGVLKPTEVSSAWGHIDCCFFVPELWFENPTRMDKIVGFEYIPPERKQATCSLCNRRVGVSIQCCYRSMEKGKNKQCNVAFHVSCAKRDPSKKYKVALIYAPPLDPTELEDYSVAKVAYCPAHRHTKFDGEAWVEEQRAALPQNEQIWSNLKQHAAGKSTHSKKYKKKRSEDKKVAHHSRSSSSSLAGPSSIALPAVTPMQVAPSKSMSMTENSIASDSKKRSAEMLPVAMSTASDVEPVSKKFKLIDNSFASTALITTPLSTITTLQMQTDDKENAQPLIQLQASNVSQPSHQQGLSVSSPIF